MGLQITSSLFSLQFRSWPGNCCCSRVYPGSFHALLQNNIIAFFLHHKKYVNKWMAVWCIYTKSSFISHKEEWNYIFLQENMYLGITILSQVSLTWKDKYSTDSLICESQILFRYAKSCKHAWGGERCVRGTRSRSTAGGRKGPSKGVRRSWEHASEYDQNAWHICIKCLCEICHHTQRMNINKKLSFWYESCKYNFSCFIFLEFTP